MLPTVCACSKLRRAARAVTRVYDAALAPWGLTTTQFAILRTLQRLGPTSVAGLARATGHERSAMTRNLAPLARAGLVAIGDGADLRSHAASITDEGRHIAAAAEPGWSAAQATVEAQLGAAQHAELFALLDRIEILEPAGVPA